MATTTSRDTSRPKKTKTPKPVRAKTPPRPPLAKAAKSAGPRPGMVTDASLSPGEGTDNELKKQELLAMVVDRADVKKKTAKPVVEAVLAILGEALAEGREFNLQPLGKFKHNRTKDSANARVIIGKIRQPKESASADGTAGADTTSAPTPDAVDSPTPDAVDKEMVADPSE